MQSCRKSEMTFPEIQTPQGQYRVPLSGPPAQGGLDHRQPLVGDQRALINLPGITLMTSHFMSKQIPCALSSLREDGGEQLGLVVGSGRCQGNLSLVSFVVR